MKKEDFLKRIASSQGTDRFDAKLEYSKYLRQSDVEESAKLAKEVLQAAIKQGNKQFEMQALAGIATSYFYNSNFEQVEFWVSELLSVGKAENNFKAIADAYNMKARVAYQKRDLAISLKFLLKALDYYLQINAKKDLAGCYNALGLIHLAQDQVEQGKQYLEKALRVADELGLDSRFSIRLNLSNILYQQNKFQETLKINQELLIHYRKQNQNKMAASALNNIGLCNLNLGNYNKAISAFEESLNIFLEMNRVIGICQSYNFLAICYLRIKDFKMTKKNLDSLGPWMQKNEIDDIKTSVYSTYSEYYEALGNFEKALEYERLRFDLNKEITRKRNKENLANLEAKYQTRIYKMENSELDQKNTIMQKQIEKLNASQKKLQNTYQQLQREFQSAANSINFQSDIQSTNSRMSWMGDMISAIAHQWKQPLNVIWVLTQAIGDAWEFNELDNDFLQNQISQIGEQVKYMSETINDFRNFFQQGKIKDFKVSEVIDKSLKLVSYLNNRIGVEVKKTYQENCLLSGNPNDLSQVLINIFNNARQSIERHKPDNPLISVNLECDDEQILISIFNSGKTIPPDDLKQIFEPYFSTKGDDGTGIGLNICRQIVEEKFYGSISAENRDSGVEFLIKIPLH